MLFLKSFAVRAIDRLMTCSVLKDETVKTIFDNIRNTSLAGLVYWGGLVLYLRPAPTWHGAESFIGGVLILIALLLLIISVLHGIRKIMQVAEQRILAAAVSLVFYVCVMALFSAVARTRHEEVNRSTASTPAVYAHALQPSSSPLSILSPEVAALLGAVIGGVAGLAGGGFAALAALRASQLASRAPLGLILSGIANTLIQLRVTTGTSDQLDVQREFKQRWSELSIQQRILCPSTKIESLLSLLLATGRSQKDRPDDLLNLAAQTLEKVTRMVGAHSRHLFRWHAGREEVDIIRDWLASQESQVLSKEVRQKLSQLIS